MLLYDLFIVNQFRNAADSHGQTHFDETKCLYTLAIGGLIPNNLYKWKVINLNKILIALNLLLFFQR